MAQECGWHYIEHENRPLSVKWNQGIYLARDLGVDAVIIIGSDDFLSNSIFQCYIPILQDGFEFISFTDLYIFNSANNLCGYYKGRTGTGRCISASGLNKIDWTPWPIAKNSGLDFQMEGVVKNAGLKRKILRFRDTEPKLSIVCIKSNVNITSFFSVNRRSEKVDFKEIWSQFDHKEVVSLLKVFGERSYEDLSQHDCQK